MCSAVGPTPKQSTRSQSSTRSPRCHLTLTSNTNIARTRMATYEDCCCRHICSCKYASLAGLRTDYRQHTLARARNINIHPLLKESESIELDQCALLSCAAFAASCLAKSMKSKLQANGANGPSSPAPTHALWRCA